MTGMAGYSLAELRAATSDDAVVGRLLERNARERPDEVFVRFDHGGRAEGSEADRPGWTRREALDAARVAAAVLRGRGVGPGDRVGVLLPNSPAFLAAWWGAALLGAVTVPFNTAFRGEVLARALRIADPAVLVVAPDLAGRLAETGSPVPRLDPAELAGGGTGGRTEDSAPAPPLPEVHLWDDLLLVQTSGTSGPSKFVRVSHFSPWTGYSSVLAGQGCTRDDVFQVDLPMFHMAALGYVHACLATRARMVVRSRPALDRYWAAIRDDDVTCGILMSSMVPLMLSRPPEEVEREHRLRFLVSIPVPADVAEFRRRFAVPRLLALYGSTEISAPLLGEGVPGRPPGYCGGRRPGWELRVVDEHDQDVPVGAVGEAIVRADRPFMTSSGYHADPGETARAWRHGWYHTGDLLRAHDDGGYSFVDRAGDAIRRRGENISAYEVEAAVATHPVVAEVACVAVPADAGVDHEVKAWIVPRPGADLDPADLLRHCAAALPHFMVPRYYECVAELPKTPSAKVQKYLLRARGNTAATWDSHRAGLRVTRRGVEERAGRPAFGDGSTPSGEQPDQVR